MNTNITNNICEKKERLQEIIKKTILIIQKYKVMDIFGSNELNVCINNLNVLFDSLSLLSNDGTDENKYKEIIKNLSELLQTFGTDNVKDLIFIIFDDDIQLNLNTEDDKKLKLILKYLHPISFSIKSYKNTKTNCNNLECVDLSKLSDNFHVKVYGIKLTINIQNKKKSIVVCGILDDLLLHCLNYEYICNKIKSITIKLKNNEIESEISSRFISCLTIKDFLVSSDEELIIKLKTYINEIGVIKNKTITQLTNDFLKEDLFAQRKTIIQLLLNTNDQESLFLAYLLYDLLTNDHNQNIDTNEQTLLFDSLPWNIKKYFKEAMTMSIEYNSSKFDNNKIDLEQQIYLIKANDNVKEKALLKLKEVKAKNDDSGSKARQYIEGLLKIPFGIFKEEQILNIIPECKIIYNNLIKLLLDNGINFENILYKDDLTSVELKQNIDKLNNYNINVNIINHIISNLPNIVKRTLKLFVNSINNFIKKHKLSYDKISKTNQKNNKIIQSIIEFLNFYKSEDSLINNNVYFIELLEDTNNDYVNSIYSYINSINCKFNYVNSYMSNINNILDDAVYGHNEAKRQIERIIGQWVNGKQSGYCFGFEGPPGVGKTSLAKKGIAKCLLDENNVARPFSFIAIGGSSNGSILDGHNYTYVGSNWGRIVDILMEKKCMNPIIFIDELDKISNTEQGKEIIGILTHLVDTTQNNCFQDKYFNGIDLDLSKVLFIFSYNDVSLVDRILLDRIHRIKFNYLTIDDKIVITNKFILKEIYENMGLVDVINIENDVIEYIIEEYTNEPGVRKLKELLFEIVGEINLNILKEYCKTALPINVTINDIKNKYLADKESVKRKHIVNESKIGLINGLWANSLGNGGIVCIECNYFPSNTFLDLKLTGMQGDVMKESMNVAKSLAWDLLTEKEKENVSNKLNKSDGIHIHLPEGATPKDGPSAGTAITIAIYSLFTGRKIKNTYAITGEICLQGNITEIGGLEVKLLGGIKSGVTTFIYPKDNHKDYLKFIKKYSKYSYINYIGVDNINSVLDIIFD
tara:strand:+ start:134 stop:3238 length:3105 start_codon:yes stop_codon:yes gene_type:complete